MDNTISSLITKHLRGELNADEQQALQAWLDQNASNRTLFDQLTIPKGVKEEMKGYEHLPYTEKEAWKRHITRHPLPVSERRGALSIMQGWKKYAAIIILAAGLSVFFYLAKNNKAGQVQQSTVTQLNLKPASPGATLTLSDGTKVSLDSINQTLSQGTTTLKNQSGQLIYSNKRPADPTTVLWNTLTTGRGQIFPIVLSDGTKIWLNAASSVRYPVQFSGRERHVEVSGEALFKVNADIARPFIVTLSGKLGAAGPVQIRVTGTVFNVNNYPDEPQRITTLLEGRIQMQTSTTNHKEKSDVLVLKPGQAAIYASDTGTTGHIVAADTEAAIAWKNGFFQFDETDLATVARQLSRWYNIDIVCKGALAKRAFSGDIDRTLNAEDVLRVLKDANIHFRVEDDGRRIVIYE